jgi:hypothetical protein
MNFFDPLCQEPPHNHMLFGLCDDENGKKAYTNTDNPESWIASVKNDKVKALVFTAIDKCVIKDGEEVGRGRCDGMLTSDEHLYFIELKNVNYPSWRPKAIEQLESTIQFFLANHNASAYRHKKAFACNKKKPKFQIIEIELKRKFFDTYGFRIDAQAEVVVI